MKRFAIYVMSLFFALSLSAQQAYVGIFDGEDLGEPLVHADGIYQFFVDSDNLVRRGFPERALLKLDAAIGQHPYFVETYLRRARLLQRLGRYTEAEKDLDTAYRLNPVATDFFHRGNKNDKLRWIDFSPSDYQDYINQFPDQQSAALLQESLKKKVEGNALGALLDLEKVMRRNGQADARLHGLKANLYLIMEDYHNAVFHYDKAVQLEPEQAKYYFNRAVAKLFTYDRSAACLDLEASNRLGYVPSQEKLKYFCYY